MHLTDKEEIGQGLNLFQIPFSIYSNSSANNVLKVDGHNKYFGVDIA